MKKRCFVPAAVAGVLAGGAAHASSLDGVVYGGGVVSEDPSGFLGVTRALPGSELGKGFAVKAAVGGGAYRYDSGSTQIKARYYSGHVGLVYQESGDWGWANASAGPRLTQTNLTPDDPFNERAGMRVDAVMSTDGALSPDGLGLAWYAETGVRDRSYVAKIQLMPPIAGSRWRVGVEGLFQGDRQYDRQGVGAAVAAKIRERLEVQVSGGLTFQSGRGKEPYLSISFSKLF